MKLLKSYLKEFAVVGVLWLICLGIAKLLITMYFRGRTEVDFTIDGTQYQFDLIIISICLLIPFVCFIYGIRFLFFRPRNLVVGFTAICYMLLGHVVLWFYSPLYLLFRMSTSDQEINIDGNYMDDDYFSKLQKVINDFKASISIELLWIQLGIGLITITLIILLISEFIKRKKIQREN